MHAVDLKTVTAKMMQQSIREGQHAMFHCKKQRRLKITFRIISERKMHNRTTIKQSDLKRYEYRVVEITS